MLLRRVRRRRWRRRSLRSRRHSPGRWIDAEDYGFTYQANSVNVDTAWNDLITELDSSTPDATTVVFPPGIHVSTAEVDWGDTLNVRLIGSGTAPTQQNGIDRYRQTIFQLNGSGTQLMSFDGGAAPMKGGPIIENCLFYWNGTASAVALYINNFNDWRLHNCGFSGKNSSGVNWDKAIQLEAVGGSGFDNAHSTIDHCFSYASNRFLHGISGYGCNVFGGEIIGDSSADQYGFYLEEFQEMSVFGTKCVNTQGGVAYIESGLNVLMAVRGEACGDATHPVVHIVDGGGGVQGDYNRMAFCTFNGNNTQLPTLLDTGTTFNYLVGNVHYGMAAHSGLAANEVKNAGAVTNIIKDQMTEQVGGYDGYKIGFAQAPVIRQGAYTVTNPSTDRALNVTADTLPQVAAVLGTLVADLTALGLLGSSP